MPIYWSNLSADELANLTNEQWAELVVDPLVSGDLSLSVAVVYREDSAESLEFATYYADKHGIDHAMLVPVPCTGDEILSSYAAFQTQIENPLIDFLADEYGLTARIIIVGYGVPGGFHHSGNIISTTSRLSRIHHTFDPGMSNPLFARQRFKRYDDDDADIAIIASRIDAPTLALAKSIVNNMRLTARQGVVNGKIYFDPLAPTVDEAEEAYQAELLDFEAQVLPVLNIPSYKTTFWDEYTDVVIPKVSADSFMWSWKADRAGYTFFKEKTTARVFLYNGDTDGAESVRDPLDKRWPMLALNAGYAATAGAMSDPLPEGLLRPKPFFDALFRGASIGEAFLFAVPNLDWTITLFGDPLLTVKFPTAEVLLDGYTSASGFNLMGQHLQSAIAYYLEREEAYIDIFNIINDTDSVEVITQTMPAFTSLANGVIAETKGVFSRLVTEYTKFPRGAGSLPQFLFERGDKISRLLPLISPSASVPTAFLFDFGYWQFEDEIQHPVSDFAKYTFILKIATDDLFTVGSTILTLDTSVSTAGWYYEKESNQFVEIPQGGILSSFAGRRIRYVSPETHYFDERKVYYARIWQENEFSETTPTRTFKQVVGT
jgi:uncharacterized protein (TIGR03790 family)